MNTSSNTASPPSAWSRFSETSVTAFHRYAAWLVSITWGRFFVLSLVLIIVMGIIHDLPPLSFTYHEVVEPDVSHPPKPPRPPPQKKAILDKGDGVNISIDEKGVHITTAPPASPPSLPAIPAPPAVGASTPASGSTAAASEPAASAGVSVNLPGVHIKLPPGSDSNEVRKAINEAKKEIKDALEEARKEAENAFEEDNAPREPRIIRHKIGDPLMPLTMWFILLSAILKITYKGKVQAEAKAAQATEVAESESLKRQVVEARMAAMQAQVEPHFLFNTLASIDHLIETDPQRASIMQKNLIALLRASMPTMREANAQATRDLGKELAMIRPYLEILKVRMEERLQTDVRVSDGLLSAEFPPMMLQSLVENAIKHGLEPKAEGGTLTVSAEIVHGKLAVTVADTGLGFGKADTAGTGIGLSNIRERLALLYGGKASLVVKETPGGGTSVTITIPYVARTAPEQSETI
ncbi:MAG: sensor histidine kinase [Rhodoferax sp.]|nr:sensor histidine kinase [Rhodoferax sp.]